MSRRLLLAVPLALSLATLASARASAQASGFVHLQTHLGSENPLEDHGVLHTYIQGSTGLQETFTEEYAPGTYTLARVDALISGCVASSGSITFTITSGQWTNVDVPVSFQNCYFESLVDWNPTWGFGSVTTSGGSINPSAYTSCAILPSNTDVVWQNWHSCHGIVAFGALLSVTTVAAASSCCSSTTQALVDTSVTHQIRRTTFTLNGTDPSPPVMTNPNIEVREVGSNDGGQVLSATFRLVNHGPGVARGVTLIVGPSSGRDDHSQQVAHRAMRKARGE